MKLFKRKYTAKDVTKSMTAMMFVYLNEMQKHVERKKMSEKLIAEKMMLQTSGLFNTKNLHLIAEHENEIAQYNANVECFKFMTEAWKLFGNDVMIVRYDQFMRLLEKYNLVCGDLSRYTGYIPEKNLADIVRIKSMNVPDKFAVSLRKLQSLKLDHEDSELIRTLRFPFKPSIMRDCFKEMNIPHEQMNFIRPWFKEFECYERFFIAAPAQEMVPLIIETRSSSIINEAKKLQTLQEYAKFIQTSDPFFCSCTEYGVLIFSKWGDEAQDEIIKRYELLSETINN